jgi:hypothetical protein
MGPEEAKAVQATVERDAAAKAAWAKVKAAKAAWAKVEVEPKPKPKPEPKPEPEPEPKLEPEPKPELSLALALLASESAKAGGDENVEDYSPRPYTPPQKRGDGFTGLGRDRQGHSEVHEGFTRLGRYIGPDTHEIRGVLHVTTQEFARRAPPMFASTVQYLVARGEIKAVRVKVINGRKLSPPRIYIPVSELERIIAEGPEIHCNLTNRTLHRQKSS